VLKSNDERFKTSEQRHSTILMLLTNSYDPDPRVRQEALSLLAMGCRVVIVAWDRDHIRPKGEVMEDIQVKRVWVPSTHGRGNSQLFFYIWVYLKMFWRAWSMSFDAVHCHDLDTLPLGFALAKLRRRPVIYDAHESFPDMLQGNVHPLIQRALVHLENFLIRRIDLLITVGEKLRRHFESRGASRSVVVGNWKRLEDFSTTPDEDQAIRRRLRIPNEALVVVCITQLLTDRKIEELLDAVDHCPDVYLLIGGKGTLEPLVTFRAAQNPHIRFLGFLSLKEISSYTCAADAVYYGFDPANPNARFSAPNKLFEALAAGRPLITGDFGEIAEVVRQAQCGIVLREYTAREICNAFTALSNSGVRDLMAANARRFGQTSFVWEKTAETLNREYSRFLPGLRQPSSAALNMPAVGGS